MHACLSDPPPASPPASPPARYQKEQDDIKHIKEFIASCGAQLVACWRLLGAAGGLLGAAGGQLACCCLGSCCSCCRCPAFRPRACAPLAFLASRHHHAPAFRTTHHPHPPPPPGTYANLVKQAKSKQKILDKMEAAGLTKPVVREHTFKFSFPEWVWVQP
jgi:hypothetical protein